MGRPSSRNPAVTVSVLVPIVSVVAALIISGLIIFAVGEDPVAALSTMMLGAFGTASGLGYTLFYATSLMFTGLAVAVALQGGLFNIGGEGQAYLGGLGVGLACLSLPGLPWWAALPVTVAVAALFGAGWAAIPGWLQAYRGSHAVITTIMFNFIASALMVYLMVNILIRPGQMAPETVGFDPSLRLPRLSDVAGAVGIEIAETPLNITFLLALAACFGVWVLVWRTRWGYALRTVGTNVEAARYAGIDPRRVTLAAMLLSGALAGLLGVNEIQGLQQKLVLGFPAGLGFAGIAVALMGRGHPAGIIPAAVLFGGLTQGGAELAFEYQSISSELVIVIQGIVILFAGALENLFRPALERLLRSASLDGEA